MEIEDSAPPTQDDFPPLGELSLESSKNLLPNESLWDEQQKEVVEEQPRNEEINDAEVQNSSDSAVAEKPEELVRDL